jgi:branched-chain amino acid transport system permease protein
MTPSRELDSSAVKNGERSTAGVSSNARSGAQREFRNSRAWHANLETGAWLCLAIALALAPLLGLNAYGMLLGFLFFQYVALGQAWNLQGGYAGLISLGSGAFVGAGEYAAGKIVLDAAGTNMVVLVLAGGIVAGLLALVISAPLFRLRGVYFAIGTLAIAEILQIWLGNWTGLGGGGGMVLPGSGPSMRAVYYMGLVIAGLMTAVLIWLTRTRLGTRLRAVRDNEDVAEEMGVGTFNTKLIVFVFSSFVMGLVGALQAQYLGVIEPTSAFSLQWTNSILVVVLVGGLATKVGPVIGAIVAVTLLETLSGFPSAHLIIEGVLLVIVIRALPGGIFGEVGQQIRRWTAYRKRLRSPESRADDNV